MPVLIENIPVTLREQNQWVTWRWEIVDGKWTKPPYIPGETGNAKNNIPATWRSYAEALADYRAGRVDGIGYVFSKDDPFIGIDLDDCRGPRGEIAPWAQEIIARLDSYSEVSPSATGVKVYVIAHKPGQRCKTDYESGEVEMYERLRYFTVTGQRLDARPAEIQKRQEAVDWLYEQVFGIGEEKSKAEPSANGTGKGKAKGKSARKDPFYEKLTDDDLLRLARDAENGQKFSDLCDRGDLSYHGNDDSKADAALCAMLAFWCQSDRERMDRLFRKSKLKREKWDEQRGETTYGGLTLDFAISKCKEWYSPPGPTPTMKGAGKKAEPDGAEPANRPSDDWPPPAVVVLRNWLKEKYAPTFKRGKLLYSAKLGRDISISEITQTSEVLALLAAQTDAPRLRGSNVVDTGSLPYWFRTWLPAAWGDLAEPLPDEPDCAEMVEPAREEFAGRLSAGLLTMVPLSYTYRENGEERVEVQRRPILEWAGMFAKPGRWEGVRGYRIWSRKEVDRIRIAIRTELFGQLSARVLAGTTQAKLTSLCVLYGLGAGCHVQGGDLRATELTADFLSDLAAGPEDRRTDGEETHAPAGESAS
jgi:putative DNA primase/helicase